MLGDATTEEAAADGATTDDAAADGGATDDAVADNATADDAAKELAGPGAVLDEAVPKLVVKEDDELLDVNEEVEPDNRFVPELNEL